MANSHGNFQGRSEAVLAVTITFTVAATLFVGLRMISRAAIVRKISIDDYFMILAWLIAVGLSSAICYGCAWGLGRHEENIPVEWQVPVRKANYAFSVLYQPALMATKTSILAFYLSLPTQNKNFKWACIATLVVVNAGGIALGLFTVFQCIPVGLAFVYPTPATGQCSDIITIYLSSTPLNIITDLALLFLPMPILTGMRLPRKQKIILVITFSFGAFVAIVDVVRIVYLQSAAQTRLAEIASGDTGRKLSTTERTDFSWYASYSFMWSAIEVNVGIMCACVPGLKPLVSRFLPNMLRDKDDPASKNNSLSMPSGMADMQEAQRVPTAPSLPANMREQGSKEPPEDNDDGPMGMMDFLTTPDMAELPPAARTQTALTNTSWHTPAHEHNFFDFVDMKSKKSLVQVNTRESLFPISMVTILFFIWGFEYGLLAVLNEQFQRVADMTPGQSTGIHSAYFAGYALGPPLVGYLVLKHWGFKACYTVGLSIYGCGTLIFWPAAVLTSFPAFILTNLIVAFGLSILEVSANPFIFLCGPQQYGEIRLCWSQGIQAIGSIVAPFVASKAFVSQNLHAPSLINTQWAYLGISFFTILLAVAYYYVPLPEGTDDELEDAAERADGANKAKVGNTPLIWITLAVGACSLFFYCGAQEVNGTTFGSYLEAIHSSQTRTIQARQQSPAMMTKGKYDIDDYSAIAHTAFALSRFLAGLLAFWIKPRLILLGCFIGAIMFEALAMNYAEGTGIAMVTMVFFFEGPMFPLLFGQTLRGMGRHTKFAATVITFAVSGCGVFSPISNNIIYHGRGAMYALVVGVVTFAVGTIYPIALTAYAPARLLCDPIEETTRDSDDRPGTASIGASRALSFLHWRKKNRSAESGSIEWKERNES